MPWQMSCALKIAFNRNCFQRTMICSKSTIETQNKVWNMLKVNTKDTRTTCLYCQPWTYFALLYSVLLLTLSMYMFLGWLHIFVNLKYDWNFWLIVTINWYASQNIHLSKRFQVGLEKIWGREGNISFRPLVPGVH